MRWKSSLWGGFATALFVMPIAAIAAIGLGIGGSGGSNADWTHLVRYVLPQTLSDTILLLVGVGLVTAIIGTATAWLTATTDFPGRRWLSWTLVLPLTVPTYIAAYVWVEMLDYAGPVAAALREFGLNWRLPDLRSLPGAIFVLSLVLYPYVYVTARVVFAMAGASAMEVARTLGANSSRAFGTVALPLARPAIVAGVTLALLETLNDIGAVQILGVRTITWTIYETWLNRSSLAGAGQLAFALLVVVLGLAWIERRMRRDVRTAPRDRAASRTPLTGWHAAAAVTACILPVALGFLAPISLMTGYALRRVDAWTEAPLLSAAGGSLTLAVGITVFAVAIVTATQQARRFSKSPVLAFANRAATFGYAIPGTVLAIGVLVPLAAFDNALDSWTRPLGFSTGLLLTGSLAALIYAGTVRFAAIGHGAVTAGFAAISPNVDMAARTLGSRPRDIAFGVHRPMMTPALATAALLVFVDAMKELPATLLMRPFGFETLATLVYTRGSQGDFEDAAFAGLIVVAIGILPVALVSRIAAGPRIRKAAADRGRAPTLPDWQAPRRS